VEPVIDRILQLLFASDVPLRCLHRSVAKQKLNLFQFASQAVAKAAASAAKVVRCHVVYAGRQVLSSSAVGSDVGGITERYMHTCPMRSGTANLTRLPTGRRGPFGDRRLFTSAEYLQDRSVFALCDRRMTNVPVGNRDVLAAGTILDVDMREVSRIVTYEIFLF
jgi:hypothetical protein